MSVELSRSGEVALGGRGWDAAPAAVLSGECRAALAGGLSPAAKVMLGSTA